MTRLSSVLFPFIFICLVCTPSLFFCLVLSICLWFHFISSAAHELWFGYFGGCLRAYGVYPSHIIKWCFWTSQTAQESLCSFPPGFFAIGTIHITFPWHNSKVHCYHFSLTPMTFKGIEVTKCHSVVSDSATPWTVARQTPLSMESSGQVYWSGSPLASLGDHLDPGMEPGLLHCRQVLYHLSRRGSPDNKTISLHIHAGPAAGTPPSSEHFHLLSPFYLKNTL